MLVEAEPTARTVAAAWPPQAAEERRPRVEGAAQRKRAVAEPRLPTKAAVSPPGAGVAQTWMKSLCRGFKEEEHEETLS